MDDKPMRAAASPEEPVPPATKPKRPPLSPKEQRLAQALRDNLRRRKAAGQAAAGPDPTDE